LTANVGSVQLGRQLSAGKYSGALHPYVRVANVADDRLSFDDIKEMEFSPQELEHYLLRPGDIVLSEGQSLDRLGQSAMYRVGDPAVCYQKTLNRFRATEVGPLPEYAQLYFRFCMHTGVFRAAGSITTNIAHLTQEKLRRIPFVLCPVEEQRVLVERVRGALARLEGLEAAATAARAKLGSVEQAALAKAFRGELVPQDPTDEPASSLLERLRAASSQQDEGGGAAAAKRGQRRSAKGRVDSAPRTTEG
jgi:type I restriction enzyme S subunit